MRSIYIGKGCYEQKVRGRYLVRGFYGFHLYTNGSWSKYELQLGWLILQLFCAKCMLTIDIDFNWTPRSGYSSMKWVLRRAWYKRFTRKEVI
jgi:hypothetical protein